MRIGKISALITLVFLFTLSGFAAEDQKPAPASELPHFFPDGVTQTADPARQMTEYLRYLNAQFDCYQGRGAGRPLIIGDDSIMVETELVSTARLGGKPERVLMVFDQYVRVADGPDKGMVRVTTLCGQELITEAKFRVVASGFRRQIEIAAKRNFDHYKGITRDAIKLRASALGISEEEFRKHLDKQMPGQSITYREFNMIPGEQKLSDFMPLEPHLGYSPRISGVLGVAWLNTGIIYYNPQAWVRDYLVGTPGVLQHEFVHANSNLQRWPLSAAFDVELMASWPEMFMPENQIDLFFHGYTSVPRELIKMFFGFDSDEARKEIFIFDYAGQIRVDEEKWRAHFKLLETAKAEMLAVSRRAIVEFYSDQLFWMAMNDKRSDQNSAFRIVMAQNYDLCILDGCEKTMKWLKINEPKIMAVARRAWENTKKSSEGGDGAFIGFGKVPQYLVDLYERTFTVEERGELEQYFSSRPDELRELLNDPDRLMQFVRDFKRRMPQKGGAR